MTAFLAVPLAGGLALAVDMAGMMRERTALQNALDSALLAAGQDVELTLPQKRAKAELYLRANLRLLTTRNPTLSVSITGGATSLEGFVTATYDTAFMGVIGIRHLDLKVEGAVAQGTDSELDVALVLDATGSLGNSGVNAVRQAARSFKDAIFDSAADPSYVQMAVVPFAGTVNVGRGFSRSFLDVGGDAYYHARHLEWRYIGHVRSSCPSGPNWGGGGGGLPDPGDGDVESSARKHILPDWTDVAFDALGAFAGVGEALAAAGDAQAHGLPAGFFMDTQAGCDWLVNPEKINHFDLFDQLPNVDWAGCVEARREPYDTADTVPAAGNPDTLFVPYFWPDEVDAYEGWVPDFVNNYMPDIQATPPWTPADWIEVGYWDRGTTITKYLRNARAEIGALDPMTAGPNRGCPVAITPLTSNETTVTNAISAYDQVSGGGTIISEGVAWGMRVLSPAAPFTQARTGERTKRMMVVMSDGQNQASVNPQVARGDQSYRNSPYVTDYNAYGYVRGGRLSPDDRIDTFESALDVKTAQACMAAKAQGIEVFTVLFRSTDARAQQVLRDCATEPAKFFLAADADALQATFRSIAAEIGTYRLVK